MNIIMNPAAFGRLRVETASGMPGSFGSRPAAFGRLRVETLLLPVGLILG